MDGGEVVATKAWDSAVLRRLLVYARPHKRKFVASFGVLLALFVVQISAPTMLRGAIDGPVTAASDHRNALEGGAVILQANEVLLGTPPTWTERLRQLRAEFDASPYLKELALFGLGYFLIVICGAWFRYLQMAQLTRTGQAVVHDLRIALFGHMQQLDLSWFDGHPTGSLVTRVTSDIENLNELFTSGLIVLLFDMIRVVVVLGLLFWVSPELALVVLLLTPILIGISVVFRGGARKAHREVRARLSKLNGYLQEVLSGIRVVQVFRREERVSGRFGDSLAGYLQANFRTIFLFALFYPILSWVTTLIQGSILWSGGDSITAGTLTVGQFILFWFWLQLFIGPIRELGERYNVLQSAFASAERIFDILDTKPELTAAATPTAARGFRGHVRFENVSFHYGNGVPILKDVSFEIPAGDTVAVVGATGAGKSTVVNLLLRYYDPTGGRITIDGVDLREMDPAHLRRHLGLVLQEDYLFSGTVRDNLELGRDWVTEESLGRALEASSAGDVVARLEKGLDTVVAERGATLSTGERELVSIARALAGNPGLVILDEATASVDSATEARIEEATHRLLSDRSALVVAHRLSTVRRASKILVMHHGEVRESGTHAELLEQDGLYARLHALQFEDPEEPPDPGGEREMEASRP